MLYPIFLAVLLSFLLVHCQAADVRVAPLPKWPPSYRMNDSLAIMVRRCAAVFVPKTRPINFLPILPAYDRPKIKTPRARSERSDCDLPLLR